MLAHGAIYLFPNQEGQGFQQGTTQILPNAPNIESHMIEELREFWRIAKEQQQQQRWRRKVLAIPIGVFS